ncbi:MAG: hypothetical protein JXA97_07960 [Anaerolineales bacterium]|nr:hypothetical protein [Anaerolineales bacterium]
MTETQGSNKKLERGRKLAREIYEWDLKRLMAITREEKDELHKKYSGLSRREVDDVVQQVKDARQVEIQRVGWMALPHDLTVIVTAILTAVFRWRVGVIGYVATLILLESIAQFIFSAGLYRILSFAVWLTYPAYILFAYSLYRQGFPIWQAAAAAAVLWIGTFLLGSLARLPSRLIIQNLSKTRSEFEQRHTPKK